jgi:hypothetical protein
MNFVHGLRKDTRFRRAWSCSIHTLRLCVVVVVHRDDLLWRKVEIQMCFHKALDHVLVERNFCNGMPLPTVTVF